MISFTDLAKRGYRKLTSNEPAVVALGLFAMFVVGFSCIIYANALLAHVQSDQRRVLVSRLDRLSQRATLVDRDSVALVIRDVARLDAGVESTLVRRMTESKGALRATDADSIRKFVEETLPPIVKEGLRAVIVRDIGISFLVALVLILAVEGYSRRRLQTELRDGIVEATFRRLIAPEIFETVQRHVMGASVIRHDWRLEMVLHRDPEWEGDDHAHLVSRTVFSYTLVNVSQAATDQEVYSGLDEDHLIGPVQRTLPRYLQVRVGKKDLEDLPRDPYSTCRVNFKTLVHIDKGEKVPVAVVLEEVIRVPDTITWVTTHATVGLTVVIDTSAVPEIGASVMALHPDRGSLVEQVTHRTWHLAGGVLPWQGFQIKTFRWADITPSGPDAPRVVDVAQAANDEPASGSASEIGHG